MTRLACLFAPVACLLAAAQAPARKNSTAPAPTNAPAKAGQTPKTTPLPDPRRLDELLKGFEQKTRGTRDFHCEFQRTTKDAVFQKEHVESGKAWGIKPYIGRLDIFDEQARSQVFVYTGQALYQYEFKSKQQIVHLLPEHDAENQAVPGPLSFVYGMTAAEAKRRFDMTLVKEFTRKNAQYAEIHVTPRTEFDLKEFKLTKLVIDTTTYLPKEILVVEPNGNQQHWDFTSIETNLTPSLRADQFGPLKNLPKDWRTVTNRFGEPADAPKADLRKTGGPASPKTSSEVRNPAKR
jgi:TIGR03009 family protein